MWSSYSQYDRNVPLYAQKQLQKIGVVVAPSSFQVEEELLRITHRGPLDAGQQIIQQGAHLLGFTQSWDTSAEPRHPVQTRNQHQNGRLQAKLFRWRAQMQPCIVS